MEYHDIYRFHDRLIGPLRRKTDSIPLQHQAGWKKSSYHYIYTTENHQPSVNIFEERANNY